ncbi:cytochrome P450 [Spirillospora sp. NPDC048819]|uniref:cytochrome P450 n=1 Tax=Spirillospora sp. NPDC048819 TaxID=3155268 RepID=UPI0033EC8DE7
MDNTDLLVTGHADVTAVLGDARFTVPPALGDARPPSLAWLRRTVCRFSEGADHERRRAIVVGPGPDERVAGRIAVLVQACEATAALIRATLPYARRPESRGRPAGRVVAETLRFDPPVPVMRRVAAEGARLNGRAIPRGTAVTLDLRAANRDPDVFEEPGRFDPDRREHPHLTFGAGRRPCPGGGHALELAAGVVEAVLHATEGGR